MDLFYPAETPLEWISSRRDHDGAPRYTKGKKNCKDCHDGDEKAYGLKNVGGGEYESKPLSGRRGHVTMMVQAANDGANLHLRLQWLKARIAAAEQQDVAHDTKLTLMLDDNSVKEFSAGGCWAACHVDSKKMSAGGDKQKYLAESRSRMSQEKGGEDSYLSAAELQGLISEGVFLEYWQARLNPGQAADVLDGYILEQRSENATATVSAVATETRNSWVVEFSRPLVGGGAHKAITAGKLFTVAVALHDQHTAGRYHLTSLQFTLSLDEGLADLVAVRQ